MIGIGVIAGIIASKNNAATIIPFIINNAPAFINPSITTIPFTVNSPGSVFINPSITTIPFSMNRI